jgi:hypothetical protein
LRNCFLSDSFRSTNHPGLLIVLNRLVDAGVVVFLDMFSLDLSGFIVKKSLKDTSSTFEGFSSVSSCNTPSALIGLIFSLDPAAAARCEEIEWDLLFNNYVFYLSFLASGNQKLCTTPLHFNTACNKI